MSPKTSQGQTRVAEHIAESATNIDQRVAEYALRLGDDALILSQRLGGWIAHAPEIEEDIALGNIALDLIGHARSFLSYAGTLLGKGEDDLAYFRSEPEFRCAQLFEQPNGNFADTIARQLIVSFFQFELYTRLAGSNDEMLAAIAAKAVKEVDYHRDHSRQWLLRLGDGTAESHQRMQSALDTAWVYVDELFEDDELIEQLNGIAVRPSALRPSFDALVAAVIAEATLEAPQGFSARGGGRRGVHSEQFGVLLAEMQVRAREHPGATW